MDGRAYRNLADATAAIGQFIEAVYNRQRLHSALSYLAPEAYEANHPRVLGGPPADNQAHRSSSVWQFSVSHTQGAVQALPQFV